MLWRLLCRLVRCGSWGRLTDGDDPLVSDCFDDLDRWAGPMRHR